MTRTVTPRPGHLAALAALICLSVSPVLGLAAKKAPDPTSPEFGVYVMETIDDMYRGSQSHAIMEMEVQTEHWKRTLALEAWSLGEDYSLIRILEPKKEKGTATLKAKGDLFTYLSKTGRTVKITSGMMGGSWMGSHFTNDDLVRDTRFSRDFDVELAFDGEQAGTPIYRFTITPKPDTPVVWGKVEVTVRKSDLQPVEERFFDEDGEPVRVMELAKIKALSGKKMPTEVIVRPLDGSGEYTRVTWNEVDFNVDLTPAFFSIRKLKSL
jgi:hypothetical protein